MLAMEISRQATLAALLAVCAALAAGQTNSGGRPVHKQAERLAQWKQVNMPFHSAGFSARERQMIDKLVDASQLLDDIYWRQSDLAGLTLYKTTQDPVIKRLLMIMGCRWDPLPGNAPFAGDTRMPRGYELYPHDLTRPQIEQYVQQHPEAKLAIYNPSTV